MDARRFRPGYCRLTLFVFVLAAAHGCHLPWQFRKGEEPADTQADVAAKPDAKSANGETTKGETAKPDGAQPDLPKALADDHWTQASALALRQPGPSGYFWQHQPLEAWLAVGGDHRAELSRALADGNHVVSSNAAIFLARAGDAAVVERLAAAVGNVELCLPLRSAAAEALAQLADPAAGTALAKLVEQFERYSGPAQAAYVPLLHAELLCDLAERGVAGGNAAFIKALRSPAPEVRCAALKAWLDAARPGFPEAALELRDDPNAAVRGVLLSVIAVQHPEQAREILNRGLNDLDIDARMAAIAGLAKLGGAESEAALRKLCRHPSEVARAAVVAGLAQLGADDAVLDAAKDKSWLVRQAVAASLACAPESTKVVADEKVTLAQTLLHDKSLEVQRAALESVATWPLAQGGPVLLAVLSESGQQMRKEAARKLGSRWEAAAKFPYDSDGEVRGKAMAELRQKWIGEFGPIADAVTPARADAPAAHELSDEQVAKLSEPLQTLRSGHLSTARRQEAVEALLAFGPTLIAALERVSGEGKQPLPPLVFEEVLPQISPLFAAIEGLRATGMQQRRTAAAQLVIAAAGQTMPELALARLTDLAKTENDPVVWQSLLTATANDSREDAVDMAYLAIGNGAPEVRRRACNYLAAHGDPRHVPVLIPVLADLNTPVVTAAVRALGAAGKIDDPQPLVQLMITQDKQLRLEVATSLARLKVPEGAAALERLSLDPDGEICRRAAQAMGQLGDKLYIPALLELLSAPVDVQNAALASLAELTGEDFSKTPDGLPVARDEQVRRWQHWYRDQQSSE
jgi:HEAT repeat protein